MKDMKFPLQHIASYTFRSIICFTIMICSLNVEATHIVGGDIVYRHLQDDMYEITMTIRRDCFNGAEDAPFDNPARIAIYTGEGNLATWLGDFGFIKVPYIKNDTLSSTIISDCGFIGEQVCVQEAIYVAQVRLAKRDAGYYLTYERCCRNESLNNIC